MEFKGIDVARIVVVHFCNHLFRLLFVNVDIESPHSFNDLVLTYVTWVI